MLPNLENEKSLIDDKTMKVISKKARPCLDCLRENLSLSNSELERGEALGRCFRANRTGGFLTFFAIFVAFVCLAIEIWKLQRVLKNSRDLDALKSDVDALRQIFSGQDFMDDPRAIEEQMYADDGIEDIDDEEDVEGTDFYDEEYNRNWNNYVADSNEPTAATTRFLIARNNDSMKSDESKNESSDIVRAPMRAGVEQIQSQEGESTDYEMKKRRVRYLETRKDRSKQRRAITEETPIDGVPVASIRDVSDDRRATEKKKKRKSRGGGEIFTAEAMSRKRYAARKYFARNGVNNFKDATRSEEGIADRPASIDLNEDLRSSRQSNSSSDATPPKPRAMARRDALEPSHAIAAHYSANMDLFHRTDEHTGNGRTKHHEGVFKAWQPSNWGNSDYDNNRHFKLSKKGKLTVQESGLYLVYAQIHYLDDRDENGFHVQVNGDSLFQCMVYSPGDGPKSRSCFSAQITMLQTGDHLILKDVGPASFTLFHHDKSFFGLVKLGAFRPRRTE